MILVLIRFPDSLYIDKRIFWVVHMEHNHGYGERKGCGNKYRQIYDHIILDHMLVVQTHFDFRNFEPGWKTARPYVFQPQSVSQLLRVIQKRFPTVSRTTVERHLDKLVNDHVLRKYPKEGKNNETFYRLIETRYRTRGRILVRLKK